VDELSRDEMANRRVERLGWRLNATEKKPLKQVKEAEKLRVEGGAITIEGKFLRFGLQKCLYFLKCVCA
jgi:hypothetical protein